MMKRFILLHIILLSITYENCLSQINNGWYWVNPYPNGMSITKPTFFDLNTGYSIISNRLYLTTNCGLNWIRKDEQIGYTGLYQFVDINTGWLTSSNKLFRTTNGGNNLILIDSNLVNYMADMEFLDQFGIVIGNVFPPVGSGYGELKVTTNGGNEWNYFNDLQLYNFSNVEILNDSFAIILCETNFDTTTIIRTQDKGQTWKTIKTPYRNEILRDLVVFNQQKYSILCIDKIITTSNAGANWSDIPLNPPSNNLLYKFWDSNTGIVTTYENYNFRTINGGSNWSINKTDIDYYCNHISLIPGGAGVLTGRYGTVLKTSDYGQTWSTDAHSLTFSDIRDVKKVDSNVMVTVGFEGKIFMSSDQGSHWEERNSGTNNNLLASYFINSSTGYACGYNGTILRTINGGLNWDVLPASTSQRLFDIEFINNTTGFISGNNGEILKTTNSGLTWDIFMTLNNNPQIFDINFINESTGYLGCSSYEIYKTTNGGNNWELKNTSGSISQISSLDFTNQSVGIALTFNGYILKSTNSGENWYFTDTLTQTFTPELKFTNANTGYVISNNYSGPGGPYFYKTTNRGESWDTLLTGLNANVILNGIEFMNDSIGVIVGEKGTIARTTTGGETVNINHTSSEVPSGYILSQNYPNPFNPVTKIKFTIPQQGLIRIMVYDILGKRVSILANEYLPPGTYETQWEGSAFASGVYFYKLQAADNVVIKKMNLLR